MRHDMAAVRERSLLLVVDVQEAMVKAISGWEDTLHRIRQLVRAASVLDVPILVTEHYKKGLGATVTELAGELKGAAVFEKEYFSACLEDGFLEQVRGYGRDLIVLAGMETHVCVLQTGLDLIRFGYRVHLVRNAVASRFAEDRETGIEVFRQAGAVISSAETVIFQWICRSNTPEFREVLPIVK